MSFIHVWTNTWAEWVVNHTSHRTHQHSVTHPPNHQIKISEITRTWNRHPTLNEQKMRNNSPEIEKAFCHLARSFYRTMQSTECTLKKWTAFYWKSLPRYPSPQTWKPLNESRQEKLISTPQFNSILGFKKEINEKKTSLKEFVVLLGNKSLLEGWTRFTQIKTSIQTPKKVLALGDTTWWYSSLPHKTHFFFSFFGRNPFNPSCSNRIR